MDHDPYAAPVSSKQYQMADELHLAIGLPTPTLHTLAIQYLCS